MGRWMDDGMSIFDQGATASSLSLSELTLAANLPIFYPVQSNPFVDMLQSNDYARPADA